MATIGGNLLQRTRCPYFRAEVELALQQAPAGQRLRGARRRGPLRGDLRLERALHRHPSVRRGRGARGARRRRPGRRAGRRAHDPDRRVPSPAGRHARPRDGARCRRAHHGDRGARVGRWRGGRTTSSCASAPPTSSRSSRRRSALDLDGGEIRAARIALGRRGAEALAARRRGERLARRRPRGRGGAAGAPWTPASPTPGRAATTASRSSSPRARSSARCRPREAWHERIGQPVSRLDGPAKVTGPRATPPIRRVTDVASRGDRAGHAPERHDRRRSTWRPRQRPRRGRASSPTRTRRSSARSLTRWPAKPCCPCRTTASSTKASRSRWWSPTRLERATEAARLVRVLYRDEPFADRLPGRPGSGGGGAGVLRHAARIRSKGDVAAAWARGGCEGRGRPIAPPIGTTTRWSRRRRSAVWRDGRLLVHDAMQGVVRRPHLPRAGAAVSIRRSIRVQQPVRRRRLRLQGLGLAAPDSRGHGGAGARARRSSWC